MADVSIDASVSTSTARGMRSVVFNTGGVAVAGDSVTTLTAASTNISGGTAGAGEIGQAESQSFTASSSYQCSMVLLRLAKVGTPTDNLVLTVCTGSQTGTVVATSNNFVGSSLTTSLAWVALAFPSSFAIASGTKYWLVLTRSGARDSANRYTWEHNTSNLLANGGASARNNNLWANEETVQDMLFQMTSVALVGYWFYIDGDGTFGYSKTTDGGATWGAQVEISSATTNIAFDVWFDKWTPGDSGTLIHCWYFDSSNDDVFWRTLDTASDTLGTERVAFAAASAVAGRGAFVSGTKTRSGYLYCAFDVDAGAEKGLVRSTDGGTTWSSNLSTTFVGATLDQCLLFPATGTGDNNDMISVYQNAGSNIIQMRWWDSSAATFASSSSTAMAEGGTDLTGQMGFSAALRSDGGIFCVYSTAQDPTVGSLKCFYQPGNFTNLSLGTDIATSVDDIYYPAVFINQSNNNVYAAYNGKRDGSETLGTATKIYYTKSTDNGLTWSAGDTAYQEGATSANIQVWAPLTGDLFYVGWRVGTTLVGNAVNSVSMGPTAYSLACAQGSFALGGQVTGLLWGQRAIALPPGSYALSGQSVLFPKGQSLLLALGNFVFTGQTTGVNWNQRVIGIPHGSFALTGQPVDLEQGYKIPLVQGGFTLSGFAQNLLRGKKIVLVQGAYALTGFTTNFLRTRIMPLAQGAYALGGQAINFLKGRLMPLTQGGYTLSGQAVILSKVSAKILAAVQGAFTLTGQALNLHLGRRITLVQGAFTFTGQAVNLFKTTVGAFVISITQGAFTLTGQVANLLRGRRVIAVQGAYALSSFPQILLRTRNMPIALGTFTLAGQPVILFKTTVGAFVIPIAQGAYSLSGQAVTLRKASRIVIPQGAFAYDGQPVALSRGCRISLVQDAYSLNGFPLTFRSAKLLVIAPGVYVFIGQPLNIFATTLFKFIAGQLAGSSARVVIAGSTARIGMGGSKLTVERTE